MIVLYEWDYETVIDGEVEDHNHQDKLSYFMPSDKTDTLVLVRDEEDNRHSGIGDRYWAYVVDGKLPEYFSDAVRQVNIKVPQRLHKELKSYLKYLTP